MKHVLHAFKAIAYFIIFSCSLPCYAQLVINEVQSINYGICVDDQNNFTDWVELYNGTAKSLKLDNMYLSDDFNQLKKWRFPKNNISVASKDFYVVYLSGRDVTNGSYVHTNFNLDNHSAHLYLSDTSGKIIDDLLIEGMSGEHSMGRINDGGAWYFIAKPTPGATNNGLTGFPGYCKPPVFGLPQGAYYNNKYLPLTSPDSSNIRYTIDGSTPRPTSKLYTNSIKLNKTMVVKARCYKTGYLPSEMVVNTYFVNDTASTLPIISISLPKGSWDSQDSGIYTNYSNQTLREGYVEVFDKDGKPLYEFAAGLAVNGGYTKTFSMKSLVFETKSYMDNSEINYQVFPEKKINKFKSLYLRNSGNDFLNRQCTDILIQSSVRKTNNDIRDYISCIAYVNGEYYGLFELREKEDNDYIEENWGYDKDSIDMLRYGSYVQHGSDSAWKAMISYISTHDLSVDSNYDYITQFIDLDNLCDYIVAEIYPYNEDWPWNNIRWWRPRNDHGKWRYILWDTDFGFGLYNTSYTGDGIQFLLNTSNDLRTTFSGLLANDRFKYKFSNRYADLINTIYRPDSIKPFSQAIFDKLEPELPRLWKRYTGNYSYSTWTTRTGDMLSYMDNRVKYGRGTILNSFSYNDSVHVTIDVSPKGAGQIQINTVIPDTLKWKGTYFDGCPINLTAIPKPGYTFSYWKKNALLSSDTAVKTLSNFNVDRDITFEAVFTGNAEPTQLTFSEINYNSDPSHNSGNYVEIKNYGQADVDISLWRFETNTQWKYFVFPMGTVIPAGEYLILCEDSAKFNAYFPGTNRVFHLGFGLDNSADHLTLFDNTWHVVLDMSFTDQQPWPLCADGHGRTMELINDSADITNPANWFNGAIGGSGGTAYQQKSEPFVITEINYNSSNFIPAGDWVELYNPSNQTVDISKWKYRGKLFNHPQTLPANVSIPAGGFLILASDTGKFFKQYPGLSNVVSFAGLDLSSKGDPIKFYDTNDSIRVALVYDNKGSYTTKANGQGFTLALDSQATDFSNGNSWYADCLGGSPGQLQGQCAKGILISEINYKSATFLDAGDWIEIRNTQSQKMDLSGWKLTDDNFSINQFIFPQGTSLDSGARLVLAADTAKFDQNYPYVKNRIGGFTFNFSGSGDEVRLYDAGDHLECALRYSDSLPWVEGPDGWGYTLELKDEAGYFSDPSNWFRGCLGGSPGSAYQTCSDSLAISEINYNSHPKSDAGDWVELYNFSSAAIDISGWIMQDASLQDTFSIPAGTIINAGQRVVLTNKSVKFSGVFPNVSTLGEFSFGLASTGDMVRLRDATGRLRVGLEFKVDSLWPSLPNGQGYTLELINPQLFYSDPTAWRISCPGGTPAQEPGNCTYDMAISEINYNSHKSTNAGDWIEFYNHGKVPVDLSGMTFTNQDSSGYFVIPTQKSLLFQGDYAVLVADSSLFDARHSGIPRIGNFGFDLKSTGEKIKLYSSNGLVVAVTYQSSYKWPQGPNGLGKTLERVDVTNDASLPNSWFEGCMEGSPGEGFKPCKPGLVVSEINYGPGASLNAGIWFELHNTGTDTLNIGKFALHNTSSANTFTIPAGTTLNPGGYLICSGDTSRFHRIYPNVPVIGNFAFNFYKTDRIRVDNAAGEPVFMADYNYQSPWPTDPDGKGYTLELIDTLYAYSQPGNWFVGCFGGSPGEAYAPCSNTVQITELNYHPDSLFAKASWIELKNNGTHWMDLSGWKLMDSLGQYFTFPGSSFLAPSKYLVVTTDTASFDKAYYKVARLGSGLSLQKDAGFVYLSDAMGNRVESIQYANRTAWPQGADGLGRTLERVSVGLNPLDSTTWFEGCLGGSPGADYSPCTEKIKLTEINYASGTGLNGGDWMEWYNTTSGPLDLSGWLIRTGSGSVTIPKGTILQGGQYLVFTETDAPFKQIYGNGVTTLTTGLSLMAGDDIHLYSKGNILEYAMRFGASSPWADANGTYYTLNANTGSLSCNLSSSWSLACPGGSPGTATMPCEQNIIFSEINYDSDVPTGAGDWIELNNQGKMPVDISGFVFANSDSSWNHKLGAETMMLPGQYRVLVADTNAFDGYYKTISREFLPGLFLENTGDQLKIYTADGSLVEDVYYQTATGWPTDAAGLGGTLERLTGKNDPNVASSWMDGCPGGSPGAAYTPCQYPVVVSEINYNANPNWNAGDWLEMHNTTAGSKDISGWMVKNDAGQTWTIPSGTTMAANGYVVAAMDQSAFAGLYPSISTISVSGFGLNDGDFLRIYNAQGELQFTTKYQTSTPWTSLPNGNGNTLELDALTTNHFSDATHWFAGCFGGSPGTGFVQPCSLTGINQSIKTGELSIYPNPTTGNFQLKNTALTNGSWNVEVYSATGAKVWNKWIPAGDLNGLSFDLSSEAKGVYRIRLTNGNQVYAITVVKE